MIKVPQQSMTSYDRIANDRPVYTVIDQWYNLCWPLIGYSIV